MQSRKVNGRLTDQEMLRASTCEVRYLRRSRVKRNFLLLRDNVKRRLVSVGRLLLLRAWRRKFRLFRYIILETTLLKEVILSLYGLLRVALVYLVKEIAD